MVLVVVVVVVGVVVVIHRMLLTCILTRWLMANKVVFVVFH